MFFFLFYLNIILAEAFVRLDLPQSSERLLFNKTRRILGGHEAGDTRPYMVYLRPASTATSLIQQNWLCGGAIIDERYILTSAACIEDVKHFYVVSGAKKWTPPHDNDDECVKNGAKKAVWKCVPKSYIFDGDDFDNIRWMINDIAVVKVEEEFNFNRRIRGCDFIPKKISYNNQSVDLEKPKTLASISGWGSTAVFSDVIETAPAKRSASNSDTLLETDVIILNKKNCKKRWHERYHYIIDKYMICGKDSTDTEVMSTACEQEVNCKELVYSDEQDEDARRTMLILDPEEGVADGGQALRRSKALSGGFCENDHGGPLVVGHGKTSMVIGVISANQVRDRTHQCYGPFLYTSVWNNRHLISCAIDKEFGSTCRKLLRASRTTMAETFFTWDSHPDGPAKNEEPVQRHRPEEEKYIEVNNEDIQTPATSKAEFQPKAAVRKSEETNTTTILPEDTTINTNSTK